MKRTFHDLFTEVGKATKRTDKIAILQKHSSAQLKQVLGLTYDPRVVWLLPEGEPPYKPMAKASDQESGLFSEVRKLYLFVKGDSPQQRNLKQLRREQLFVSMLESIDPDDAKVLLAMKEGKLPYKGLTRKLVADAFPNMAKDW
jgi:hypothetical protein